MHFDWGKTVEKIRPMASRGLCRVDHHFKLEMVASNLWRMVRLMFAEPARATNEAEKTRRARACLLRPLWPRPSRASGRGEKVAAWDFGRFFKSLLS